MHNLAVTVVVSEIFYTQADLCIIILCIMRMSTVYRIVAQAVDYLSMFGTVHVPCHGDSGRTPRPKKCKSVSFQRAAQRQLGV